MVTIHLVYQPETSNFSLNLLSSNFTQSTRSIEFSVNIFHFFHHYLYSRLEYHDLTLKLWHRHLYLSATNKPATLTQQNPYPNPPSSKSLSALWRPSVFWLLLLSSHNPLPTSVSFFFFLGGVVLFLVVLCTTCRILAPWSGIELVPPEVEAQSSS